MQYHSWLVNIQVSCNELVYCNALRDSLYRCMLVMNDRAVIFTNALIEVKDRAVFKIDCTTKTLQKKLQIGLLRFPIQVKSRKKKKF